MSSSCSQSVSVTTVCLLFLAFYPRHRLHNAASSHSERFLFRSESRKSQVRKKTAEKYNLYYYKQSCHLFFFLSLLCNVHTTNMLTYITEEPIYEYFWLKSITHNWQCLRFFWSSHSCNRTKPQEKSNSINICQGLYFTKHPLPAFIYQLRHLTQPSIYNTSVWRIQKALKWSVVSLSFFFHKSSVNFLLKVQRWNDFPELEVAVRNVPFRSFYTSCKCQDILPPLLDLRFLVASIRTCGSKLFKIVCNFCPSTLNYSGKSKNDFL